MVDKQEESRGENSAANADDRFIAGRVQELSWALLDEQINDDEFRLLENLLLSDDKCRDSYIGCVQLHADLLAHFAGSPTNAGAKVKSGSQILGFINAESPLSFPSPSGEESLP